MDFSAGSNISLKIKQKRNCYLSAWFKSGNEFSPYPLIHPSFHLFIHPSWSEAEGAVRLHSQSQLRRLGPDNPADACLPCSMCVWTSHPAPVWTLNINFKRAACMIVMSWINIFCLKRSRRHWVLFSLIRPHYVIPELTHLILLTFCRRILVDCFCSLIDWSSCEPNLYILLLLLWNKSEFVGRIYAVSFKVAE